MLLSCALKYIFLINTLVFCQLKTSYKLADGCTVNIRDKQLFLQRNSSLSFHSCILVAQNYNALFYVTQKSIAELSCVTLRYEENTSPFFQTDEGKLKISNLTLENLNLQKTYSCLIYTNNIMDTVAIADSKFTSMELQMKSSFLYDSEISRSLIDKVIFINITSKSELKKLPEKRSERCEMRFLTVTNCMFDRCPNSHEGALFSMHGENIQASFQNGSISNACNSVYVNSRQTITGTVNYTDYIFSSLYTSYSSGGAIHANPLCNLTLNLCEFSDCLATNGDGGSIYTYNATLIQINNTNFKNSSAYYSGGTIRESYSKRFILQNVKIQSSLSKSREGNLYGGGGVYISEGVAVVLNNVTCKDCKSNHSGGGMLLTHFSSSMSIVENTFDNCSCYSGYSDFGGGICFTPKQSSYSITYYKPNITFCEFLNNYAGSTYGDDLAVDLTNYYPSNSYYENMSLWLDRSCVSMCRSNSLSDNRVIVNYTDCSFWIHSIVYVNPSNPHSSLVNCGSKDTPCYSLYSAIESITQKQNVTPSINDYVYVPVHSNDNYFENSITISEKNVIVFPDDKTTEVFTAMETSGGDPFSSSFASSLSSLSGSHKGSVANGNVTIVPNSFSTISLINVVNGSRMVATYVDFNSHWNCSYVLSQIIFTVKSSYLFLDHVTFKILGANSSYYSRGMESFISMTDSEATILQCTFYGELNYNKHNSLKNGNEAAFNDAYLPTLNEEKALDMDGDSYSVCGATKGIISLNKSILEINSSYFAYSYDHAIVVSNSSVDINEVIINQLEDQSTVFRPFCRSIYCDGDGSIFLEGLTVYKSSYSSQTASGKSMNLDDLSSNSNASPLWINSNGCSLFGSDLNNHDVFYSPEITTATLTIEENESAELEVSGQYLIPCSLYFSLGIPKNNSWGSTSSASSSSSSSGSQSQSSENGDSSYYWTSHLTFSNHNSAKKASHYFYGNESVSNSYFDSSSVSSSNQPQSLRNAFALPNNLFPRKIENVVLRLYYPSSTYSGEDYLSLVLTISDFRTDPPPDDPPIEPDDPDEPKNNNTTPTNNDRTTKGTKLSIGTIICIAFGCTVLLCIVIVILVVFIAKRKKSSGSGDGGEGDRRRRMSSREDEGDVQLNSVEMMDVSQTTVAALPPPPAPAYTVQSASVAYPATSVPPSAMPFSSVPVIPMTVTQQLPPPPPLALGVVNVNPLSQSQYAVSKDMSLPVQQINNISPSPLPSPIMIGSTMNVSQFAKTALPPPPPTQVSLSQTGQLTAFQQRMLSTQLVQNQMKNSQMPPPSQQSSFLQMSNSQVLPAPVGQNQEPQVNNAHSQQASQFLQQSQSQLPQGNSMYRSQAAPPPSSVSSMPLPLPPVMPSPPAFTETMNQPARDLNLAAAQTQFPSMLASQKSIAGLPPPLPISTSSAPQNSTVLPNTEDLPQTEVMNSNSLSPTPVYNPGFEDFSKLSHLVE